MVVRQTGMITQPAQNFEEARLLSESKLEYESS